MPKKTILRWEYLQPDPDDDDVTRQKTKKLKETVHRIIANEDVLPEEIDELRAHLDTGEIDWMATYGCTKDGHPLDFDPGEIGVNVDLMRSHNNRSSPERTDGHVKMTKYIVQKEFPGLFTE